MLDHIFEIVVVIMQGSITYIIWLLQKNFSNKSASSKGMKLLLRKELKDLWSEYKKQGYVSTAELQEYEDIYTVYHELGGNGVGTRWHDEVCKLEVKE